MNVLKSYIQRMREVNVTVWAWVSHANFSRSLAELCAGWVVPVAIVGNRLMWKLKPHATRWTTMEHCKAHTSRLRAKPCLSTPSLNTKPIWKYLPGRVRCSVCKWEFFSPSWGLIWIQYSSRRHIIFTLSHAIHILVVLLPRTDI